MKTFLFLLLSGCGLALGQGGGAPAEAQSSPTRFQAYDLLIDPKGKPLAAYQIEIAAEKGQVKIAGIEGGEHPAFRHPPAYDPKAMQQDHVMLAALSTEPPDKLPSGKTRVAVLHVMITGDPPEFAVKCRAAGSAAAEKIAVETTLVERKRP
jgi:hypothetical protein